MKMDDWRLYFDRGEPVELFDLSANLDETENLVEAPEHEHLINRMVEIWHDWRDDWKLDN